MSIGRYASATPLSAKVIYVVQAVATIFLLLSFHLV